jgi:hypothetical protein
MVNAPLDQNHPATAGALTAGNTTMPRGYEADIGARARGQVPSWVKGLGS